MVRDTLKAFFSNGLPIIATALGAMWAYDKKNSFKWGVAGGVAGWAAGQVAKGLVFRVLDRDVALPSEVAIVGPALAPVAPAPAAPKPPQESVGNVVRMPVGAPPKAAVGLQEKKP